MDHFDALCIIAELALGIAGFSGVIVALGAQPSIWPRVDRLRLATLLISGLGALFLVLIAMVLLALDVALLAVWRISGFLTGILILTMLIAVVPGAWSITRQTTGITSAYSVAVFIPTVAVATATVIIQFANAAGIIHAVSFGALFGGLVFLLVVSSTQFARLLFMIRRAGEGQNNIHEAEAR